MKTTTLQLTLFGLAVTLGAATAAWFATDWLKHFSNDNLSRIFGILMILVGIRMLVLK
jgi:hypothetical protein